MSSKLRLRFPSGFLPIIGILPMTLNRPLSLNNPLVPLTVLRTGQQRTAPMAEPEKIALDSGDDAPKKRSRMPLILGFILAVFGGGAGFMAVQMGLIGSSQDVVDEEVVAVAEDLPDLAFVPLETLVINLPEHAQARHLLFTAQLEVEPAYSQEVTDLMPRIVDVLNGYLRAVKVAELEDPTALIRLRAQMLRRVQVVVGDGRVKDVLIMEFVLN
jgi:flagellar FliL protein